MIRFALTAALSLGLAAAPVIAQTPPPPPPSAATPSPGSEEWLRQRGEAYSQAPDAEQDPAELEATARLNAGIAAHNAKADQIETDGQTAYEQDNARWRDETARLETQRAQWEADTAAANAARAQWERDNAAWAADLAACERARRVCVTTAPKY